MIKTVSMIDVNDWDELVRNTYGKPYSFQQQDGCKERGIYNLSVPTDEKNVHDFHNDTIPEEINGDERGVSFKAWLARDPDQSIENWDSFEKGLFWGRNFYPTIESIAFDLYKRGLLPAGNYIIDIDW